MLARFATTADSVEVLRLARSMFESMGVDASGEQWQRSGGRSFVERLGDDLAVFVVDDPEEPDHLVASAAGVISVRLPVPWNPEGRVGYVQWVATEPAFRRRGLGRQVMAALLGWFSEHGVSVVELHATGLGESLYRSLGFEEGGQRALRRQVEPKAAG